MMKKINRIIVSLVILLVGLIVPANEVEAQGISSLAEGYCSADADVTISVDTPNPSRTGIEWEVYTGGGFTGPKTVYLNLGGPDTVAWLEYATGNEEIIFKPSQVPAYLLEEGLNFYYEQTGTSDSGDDNTFVFQTPTKFNFGDGKDDVIEECESSGDVTIILSNTEENVYYNLVKDGNIITKSPTKGKGTSLEYFIPTSPDTMAGSYYVLASGSTDALSCPVSMNGIKELVLNPRPDPKITGATEVCQGATVLYSTDTGMSGYTWTVVGGTIDAGASTNEITVTWNTAGAQQVTLNYTNGLGCAAINATEHNVTVNSVTASLNSNDADNIICSGAEVIFTAGGGDEYEFYVNGSVVQAQSTDDTYNTTTLSDGDVVSVKAFNTTTTCNDTHAGIPMTVNSSPTPTLVSNQAGDEFCIGTDVEFTAGGGDQYEFFVNGISVQAISTDNTYNTTGLADGDLVTVRVVLAGGCESTHSGITVKVNPLPVPTLTSDQPGNEFCIGTDVEFTAGGGSQYEFFVNGISVQAQSTDATYNTTSLSDGDVVRARVVSIVGCQATSSDITVTVNYVTATLVSSDTDNTICPGTDVTFTAGGGDEYEFYLNGGVIQAQSIDNTYNSTSLSDGDVVSVKAVNTTTTCNDTHAGIATTVIVAPIPTLVSDQPGNEFCLGTDVEFIGGGGDEYEFFVNGTSVQAQSTDDTYNTTGLADGNVVTVRVVNTTTGCEVTIATGITVKVNPLPVPTLVSNQPGNEFCFGTDVEFTAGGGDEYEFYVNGISVQAQSSDVTYNTTTLADGDVVTVRVVNTTTTCDDTHTGITVIVNDVTAVLNITNPTPPGTSVCAGTTVTYSGSGTGGSGDYNYEFFVGGISQGPASSTPSIDVIINTDVVVEVEVTDNVTGCLDRTSMSMTAKPIPNVNLSQPLNGAEFCENQSVTLTAAPSGFDNYVYYSTDGTTDTPLNTLGTETFDVTAGFDPSITGVYVVSTEDGCSAQSATINISINALPTANAGSDQVICEGAALVLSGSASGGTASYTYDWEGPNFFSATDTQNPDLGTADLNEAGIYTLTVTDSKSCQDTDEVEITIDALPNDQTVVAEDAEYCEASTGVRIYLQNSEAGVRYQLQNASDTPVGTDVVADGTSTVEWTNVTAGTYHVVAFGSTANACPIRMSTPVITVQENALPTIFNITPSDIDLGCNGGAGWPIGISGSETGISYQLLRNGTPYGTAVVGTGSAITLNSNVTAFGTYTIMATNLVTLCNVLMNEDYEIQSDVAVTTYDVTSDPVSGSYCVSASNPGVTIGMSGSDATVEYQLILNGNSGAPEQTKTSTAGGVITFDNKVTIDGVYTVQVQTPGGCGFPMNGSVTVTAYDDPTVFDLESDDNGYYCPDPAGSPTGVNMWLVGQQNGIEYNLYRDNGGSPVLIETVTGSVDDPLALLNFTNGPFITEDDYYVVAQRPGVGCSSTMNNTISVTENPLLNGYNVSKSADFCTGSTVSLFIDGSESDAEYRWVVNNGATDVATSAWFSGTGSAMEFPTINIEGTYRIEVQRTENGITCSREMLNTVDVIEKPLPDDKTWITSGGTGCDDGVIITVENSQSNVIYHLYKRGTPDTEVTGAEIIGNGSDISFAAISDNGANYNIVAELDGCSNNYDVNIPVNITGAINKLTVNGGGSVCSGGTVGSVIGMTEVTVVGVTYELFLADSPGATTGTSVGVITGDGTIRNFGNQTTLGEYYVMGSNTSDGTCPTEMTNRVTISYYDDPTASISANPGVTICEGTEVTFTGSGGDNYQFYLNGSALGIMSSVNTYITNILKDGDIVSVNVESSEGCTAMSPDITMTVNALATAKDVGTTGSFCQGSPSNVSVYVTDPESGFTYTLIDESGTNPDQTDNTLPILFSNVPEGTYRVEASANGCTTVMNNTVTITANALPTIFDMDPTGSVNSCTDNEIKLLNSEAGVSYTLLRGSNIVGVPTDGSHDGVQISFGDYKVTGTYSVVATNLSSTCTSTMNGTYTITAGSGNAYGVTPADGRYCVGVSPESIQLENSDSGVDYILYLGSNPIDTLTSSADGQILDFGIQTVDGIYSVVGEDSGGCQFDMNNFVVIQQVAVPTVLPVQASNGTSSEQYCPGSTGISSIHVKGQQVNVTYTLYDKHDNVVGLETGAVDDANVDIVFAGPFTANIYHVVAENLSGCTSDMSNTVTIEESPALKDDYGITASGDICTGGSATITTNGSENNVEYWLYRNYLPTGNYIDGDGGVLDPPFTVNQGGTFTIEAINTIGCKTFLINNVVIAETNLPENKAIVSDGGTDCSAGAIITVQLAEPNIIYQLYKRTSSGDVLVNGSAISNTGTVPTDIVFAAIIDNDAYYTVKASNGSCEIDMSTNSGVDVDDYDDVYVNIIGAPIKYEVGPSDASICNGDLGTVFYLQDSEISVIYNLYVTTTAGTTRLLVDTVSSGGYLEFEGVYNIPGEYYVETIKGTCTTTMINTPTLNVNPLPTAYKMIGSGFFCDYTDGAEIKLENQEENVRYYLQFQDGLEEGTVLGGSAGDTISFGKFTKEGIYNIVAFNTLTGCTSNMEGVIEVVKTDTPNDQFLASDMDTVYCGSTAGVEFKLTDHELSVTYQVREVGTTHVISEVVDIATTKTTNELVFPDLIPFGSYTIWKTRGGDACESITNGGDIIDIIHEEEPTAHKVDVESASVCGSDGAVIFIEDSEPGRRYRVMNSALIAEVDTITSASGERIEWPVTEPGGTTEIYEIFAIAGTVCDRSMGTIEVRFNDSPLEFVAYTQLGTDASTIGSLDYCAGDEGIKIGIESTQLQVAYMLYDTLEYYNATDKSLVSPLDVIIGNGSDQLFTKDIAKGSYTIKALLYTTGCELWDDDTITISETLLPEITYDVYCNTVGNNDCVVGDSICIEPTEVDVQYTLYKDGVATTMIENGGASKICFDPIEDVATYTIVAKSLVAPYCESGFGSGITYTHRDYGELIALNDTLNIATNLLADTIYLRSNDELRYIPDGMIYAAKIPYRSDGYFTDYDDFVVDKFMNDYRKDIAPDPVSNIRFSLLSVGEDSVETEVTQFVNNIVGVYKVDSITGEFSLNKTPGFFGKDSIRYVIYNTEFPTRRDTATVKAYVGNEMIKDAKSFIIPNAFSPNNDGINDNFVISGIKGNNVSAEKSSLEVFNRWGTLVYRSKETIYGVDGKWWDGKSTTSNMVSIGSDLPNGTYFYVFSVDVNIAGNIETTKYNGFVELRR